MLFADYTMTNIQNIRLTKIVGIVPEHTIPKNCILDTIINIPDPISEIDCRKNRCA